MPLAKEIAANFSSSQGNHTTYGKNPQSKKVKEIFPVRDEKQDTAFYIINFEPEGFIVLSSCKLSVPVLAYSNTNNFETNAKLYPGGLVDWLGTTKNYIDSLKNSIPPHEGDGGNLHIKPPPGLQAEWDAVIGDGDGNDTGPIGPQFPPNGGFDPPYNPNPCEAATLELKGPFLSTTWNQRCGFNDDMPYKSCANACDLNERAFAGCVPIAMAQVMRYNEYPNSYNWSNMDLHGGTPTTASFIRDIADHIANLPL